MNCEHCFCIDYRPGDFTESTMPHGKCCMCGVRRLKTGVSFK